MPALNLNRPVSFVLPRSMREQDAANYVGFSSRWLRNTRFEDSQRLDAGEEPVGPRWVHIGRSVRYLREDLDAWLDRHRADPGQGDPDADPFRPISPEAA